MLSCFSAASVIVFSVFRQIWQLYYFVVEITMPSKMSCDFTAWRYVNSASTSTFQANFWKSLYWWSGPGWNSGECSRLWGWYKVISNNVKLYCLTTVVREVDLDHLAFSQDYCKITYMYFHFLIHWIFNMQHKSCFNNRYAISTSIRFRLDPFATPL